MTMANGRVSVVGLGKLGACLAACLAHKGFSVVGADAQQSAVELLNQGKAPVHEPGLDALIRQNRSRLEATSSTQRAVEESAITFIVVPTPSEENGMFTTQYVRAAAREIGRGMAGKTDYHLVVLVSTVLPGGTQEGVVSVVEQESGRRCPSDFGVCYNPEFIALGSVIHDMLNPELILIGQSDERAGQQLVDLYSAFVDNHPTIVRSNFANAELAKIALNSFVTLKITFANLLSQLCERIPDGDIDVVTRALGSDSRVGPRYLKGGLGFGGPCFPRDTVAFSALSRSLGVSSGLSDAVGTYNRSIAARVTELARKYLPEKGTASVLGLAYKLNTPVVEESQGLEIARALLTSGARVRVYDPYATETARQILGESAHYSLTLAQSVEGSQVVVLANPLPELQGLTTILARDHSKPIVVIDCWRCVPELALHDGIRYIGLGLSSPKSKARGAIR
jgi:UDPglucose 6-dehydrogenase